MTDQLARDDSATPDDPLTVAPRRGPAVIGAVAGVVVVAAMITVLVSHDSTRESTTAAPAASAPAAPANDRTAPANGRTAPSADGQTAPPANEQAPPPADQQTAVAEQADPAAAAAGAPPDADPRTATPAGPLARKPVVTAGAGKLTKLVVTPIIQGTGATVRKGQTVTVNYVLVNYADGTPIESSWDTGGPVPLVVGVGRLIKGWDIGLPGQRVGSRIRLDVPAGLAYGPAKGDLRFVVDILSAK
jgi:peptidylprolyl isomerase